jgi:hypothetical protein
VGKGFDPAWGMVLTLAWGNALALPWGKVLGLTEECYWTSTTVLQARISTPFPPLLEEHPGEFHS